MNKQVFLAVNVADLVNEDLPDFSGYVSVVGKVNFQQMIVLDENVHIVMVLKSLNGFDDVDIKLNVWETTSESLFQHLKR